MKLKNIPSPVGKKLLVLDYPKYVWVTEISSPVLLDQPDKKQRKCLGCVIVDSTAPKSTAGVIACICRPLLAQDRDDPLAWLSATSFFGQRPSSTVVASTKLTIEDSPYRKDRNGIAEECFAVQVGNTFWKLFLKNKGGARKTPQPPQSLLERAMELEPTTSSLGS